MLAISQTKDELDVKLQKIIQDNPEINQKIEENGGYNNLKQQLVEIAIATNQQQSESEDSPKNSGWRYFINELFPEAEASVRRSVLLSNTEFAKDGSVVIPTEIGGITTVTGIMNAPKNALVAWFFKNIGDGPSGQILKIALTLATKPESVINIMNLQQQSDFEKRKHDDNINKPSTSKQQQKVPATFMPDPGDLEPDDEERYRKSNCEKSESPIWKEFENYRDGYKTNNQKGSAKKYYKWDNTHKDIEVYDHNYYHQGSLNPKTGELYKGPVKGRRAWDIAK